MRTDMNAVTPARLETEVARLPLSSPTLLMRLVFAAAATTLLLCSAHALHAQAYPGSQQEANDAQQISQLVDPPSRVGRLSLLQGNVSFQPANANDFSAAEINYPLTTGDRIYTDNGARAELEAGQLTLRLGMATDFTVTTLSDELAQFGLAQGSVHLRPYALEPNTTTELDTPNSSITVLQAGDIRVDVSPQDNVTIVTVLSGQVQVNADGVQQIVQHGQTLQVSGYGPSQAQFVRRARPDALDQFSAQRDSLYQQQYASQGQYVNPATIGYSDLGQYGDWDNSGSSEDGPVWYPRGVAVDWAPYRVGHWAYIAPWGWTWVEAEPWGFAPFHYGRWARFGPRWGWVPGPPVVRPVYSPALVAFVGGPNFRIGGSIGVAAWFPLGPREAYQPWYHSSPSYVNRVNVTNIYNRNTVEVRNIYNNRTTNVYGNDPRFLNRGYANRSVAMTAITQDKFAGGRPVGQNALRIDPRQFDNAPVNHRPPMGGPGRPDVGAAPPRALPPAANRPVLANDNPGNRRPNGGQNGYPPQNGYSRDNSPRDGQNGFGNGAGQQRPNGPPNVPTNGSQNGYGRNDGGQPRTDQSRYGQQPSGNPAAPATGTAPPRRDNGAVTVPPPAIVHGPQPVDPSLGPKAPFHPGMQRVPTEPAQPPLTQQPATQQSVQQRPAQAQPVAPASGQGAPGYPNRQGGGQGYGNRGYGDQRPAQNADPNADPNTSSQRPNFPTRDRGLVETPRSSPNPVQPVAQPQAQPQQPFVPRAQPQPQQQIQPQQPSATPAPRGNDDFRQRFQEQQNRRQQQESMQSRPQPTPQAQPLPQAQPAPHPAPQSIPRPAPQAAPQPAPRSQPVPHVEEHKPDEHK